MPSCELSSNAGVELMRRHFAQRSQLFAVGGQHWPGCAIELYQDEPSFHSGLVHEIERNQSSENNYFGFDGLLTLENRLLLIRQPTRGAMIAGMIGSLGSAMESCYVPPIARAIRREPRKSVLFLSVHGRRL